MNRACSTTAELILLIDGELTENRAGAVRDHLQDCAACRREAEAVRALVKDVSQPVTPRPGALERLVARLDEAPRASPAVPWRGVGAVLAAVAVLIVAIGLRGRSRTEMVGSLAARGIAVAPSLGREVGVTVYCGTSRLEALRSGDEVEPDAAYSVAYRNVGSESAFAMVFARDARGAVHWIAPAWLDPGTDPASETVLRADREAPPSAAIVLDHPAPGEMHVITVLTSRPMHVTEVERAAALDAAALRVRWPGAVVDETVVRVAGEQRGTSR